MVDANINSISGILFNQKKLFQTENKKTLKSPIIINKHSYSMYVKMINNKNNKAVPVMKER